MKSSVSIFRPFLPLVVGLGLLAVPAHADVNSDLAFSSFTNVDLNALAGGAVQQSRGGLVYFQRGIISQALYMVDAAPAEVQRRLANWNPANHSELEVWVHKVISAKPTPADFAGLARLPDNKSVAFQLDATAHWDVSKPALQVNKAESQLIASLASQEKDPRALYAKVWSQILTGRITSFLSGNTGSDAYSGPGGDIHPLGEIRSLLHADPKIYSQFQRFLAQTPLKTSSSGSIKLTPVEVYYDMFDVQGEGALDVGAVYQAAVGPSFQSIDTEFFINSGVFATVEMEQLWPVTVNGKTQTLVWRGDLVSAPSIAYLHGTERLASGMIMLQEVKQGVDAFRSEFK